MDMTTVRPSEPSHVLPVRPADPAEPCCESTAASPTLDAARSATLADRLKALADPTRLRMLDLLAAQSAPLCVCEITDRFAQQQPTISHHLRILRHAGLIHAEKRGTWAYYSATEAGRRTMAAVSTLAALPQG